MKTSLVLSTHAASFNAVAYKGEIPEALARIHRLGYDGVELAVRDPKLLDRTQLDRLLQQNELQVPAIGTGQAYSEEGLSFTAEDPKIRLKAIERFQAHLQLAQAYQSVVIIGLMRGQNIGAVGVDRAEAWFAEALHAALQAVPDAKIAIEPINRYETDFIHTVEQALRFFDSHYLDSVGLLLDTFHMNIEEAQILTSIDLAGERIFHVHVADSNRWYPGAGHLDFTAILTALLKAGYTGYLSAEILPLPDADTAAQETIDYLLPLLTNRVIQ